MADIFDLYPTVSSNDVEVTAGAAADPGEAFRAAFENQRLNWSTLGAKDQFRSQIEDVGRKYGVVLAPEPLTGIGFAGPTVYDELWDYAMSDKPLTSKKALDFQNALAKAKEKDPTIPALSDIVENTRKHAAEVELNAQKTAARSGFGSGFAGFLGGMAGSFTVNDPFNIATLGVGGGGKTLATRLLTEMGANGGVEAINQFTGVADSRNKLGLEVSLNDQLSNVFFAAAGAGALRLGGEAAVAGFRRVTMSASERAAAHVMDNLARSQATNPFAVGEPSRANSRYETEAYDNLIRAAQSPATVEGANASAFGILPVTADIGPDGVAKLDISSPEIDRVVNQLSPSLGRTIASIDQKIEALRSRLPTEEALAEAPPARLAELQKQVAAVEPRLAKLEERRNGLIATRDNMRDVIAKSVSPPPKAMTMGDAVRLMEESSAVTEIAPERVEAEFDGLAKLAAPPETPDPATPVEPFSIEGIGRVDLDTVIRMDDGVDTTIRAVLASSKADDDLVNAMKVCLL